jgi:hypothetical protein
MPAPQDLDWEWDFLESATIEMEDVDSAIKRLRWKILIVPSKDRCERC